MERYRSPWSMSEVNKLHNEYELKNLPILEIAKLHKRGAHAILHKLADEGLIMESWADVKGWKFSDTSSPLQISIPVSKSVVSFDESDDEISEYEDPYDSDYVYESDEDDDYEEDDVEDDVEDDGAYEQDDGDDSSDYEDEVESVDSDSDYEDEQEAFDPYSIKQKAAFLQTIIGALKFFVYAV